MAATNISNLDGLDAVANILAAGETLLKAAVKKVLRNIAEIDPRITDLFIGQMAAEGFAPASGTGLIATLASPTVKIELYKQQAGQLVVKAYLYVGGAWSQVYTTPMNVLGV